jgi:hypothetical protein
MLIMEAEKKNKNDNLDLVVRAIKQSATRDVAKALYKFPMNKNQLSTLIDFQEKHALEKSEISDALRTKKIKFDGYKLKISNDKFPPLGMLVTSIIGFILFTVWAVVVKEKVITPNLPKESIYIVGLVYISCITWIYLTTLRYYTSAFLIRAKFKRENIS